MARTIPFARIAAALFLFALSPTSLAQDGWESWTEGQPTPQEIEEQQAQVQSRLAEVPSDATAESSAGQLKASLTRRNSLLSELRTALRRKQELAERVANHTQLEADAERELADADTGEPPVPSPITSDAVAALEAKVRSFRDDVEERRARVVEASTRADSQAEYRATLEAREREAQRRAQELAAPASEADATSRALHDLRLANARLDGRVAREARELFDRELLADGELGRYRGLMLQLAEHRLARGEEALEAARNSLGDATESKLAEAEERLGEMEREAEEAQDPLERFQAEKEAAVLRSRANAAGLASTKLQLGRAADEQQARLDADRQQLERLRSEVKAFGTGDRVGTRLRDVFHQLGTKRKAVELAVDAKLENELGEWRARRFDLDEVLYGLATTWRAQVDAAGAAAGLASAELEVLRTEAAPLRDELRGALEEERASLTDAITRADRVRGLQSDRLAALRDLETFVHAKVFWIRDGSQLDGEALRRLPGEVGAVVGFAVYTVSSETLTLLASVVRDPGNLVWGILLVLLPMALGFVRRAVRRTTKRFEESSDGSIGAWRTLLLTLAALAESVLLPAYLLALARVLPRLGVPADLGTVVVRCLHHFALVLLLRQLARLAFGDLALAHRFLGVPKDTCKALHRAARTQLVAYLALLLPWALLRAEPFQQEVLPLVALVVFLTVAATGLHRLFRARACLTRDIFNGDTSGIMRWRPIWNTVLALLLFSVPVLTASGYSFAAAALGRSMLGTLGVLAILPPLYRLTARWMQSFQAGSEPQEGEGEAPATTGRSDLRALVRIAFVVGGLLACASFWGINQQAWGVLQGLEVWRANPISAEVAEWVTVADLVLALGSGVLTLWLLRHLPGIYDLALFPRLDLDAGLRYAIVTISRYGMFFVGSMVALSFIHLDLSRLGWLVAAMGVGLGFGLQEIVSNFVCGIILLVERPIRVNDVITVGTLSGKVQRINIRATTVLNFDRLEVIVPNRNLITKEVTNWTLADEMTRLIVPIGVAYGSDLELVRSVLMQVTKDQPEVLAEPPPQVVFVVHGESSLDFEVRCFLGKTSDRVPLQDRLNTLINHAFAKNGIEIPFPQRDLHLRTEAVFPTPPPREESPDDANGESTEKTTKAQDEGAPVSASA